MNSKYIYFSIFLIIFFIFINRFPPRKPIDDNAIVTPASGIVMKINKGKTNTEIIIFLNVFNIHGQYFPCNAVIKNKEYYKGKFNFANLTDAIDNEEMVTTLDTKFGDIIIKQKAGFLFRRIRNYTEIGKKYRQNNKLGKIIMSSRVDIIIPNSLNLKIKEGQWLTAGKDVIAEQNNE